MTVAVAGAIAMPYARPKEAWHAPVAGEFVTFDPTQVIRTGNDECVPAIVRFNPGADNTDANQTIAQRLKEDPDCPAFGMCLETPGPGDQHVRILLRRDLACSAGTTA